MQLHLFSIPGKNDIRDIVEASRPYLEGKAEPVVAFLPQAWLNVRYWLETTERAFSRLARVELIDTERMDLAEMESILRRAHVAYISGGNTFLLNHRLHVSRLLPHLRKKIQGGLPVVAFSAGTVLCGPNILTSSDLNTVPTPHFDGLQVSPFNFFAHYTEDVSQDEWLSDYHVFHDNPVLLLSDSAYIQVDGKKTTLVRGDAWILRSRADKERLEPGKLITL